MVSSGQLFDCIEDVARLFKALIAFALSNLAVAMSFKAKHEVNQQLSQISDKAWLIRMFANMYTATFGIMYFVNILCVIYTFLGIGCIRNCIFRERKTETEKWHKIQCCLGPSCSTILQVLVWITLALQVAVSYGYLIAMCCLTMMLGICKAGNSTIRSFQELITEFRNGRHPKWSPLNYIMNMNVHKYCLATRGMQAVSSQCFLGCLLSVVSQVLMIAVISEEKGRIDGTLAYSGSSRVVKGVAVGDKAQGSDSDSNSGSDYEATPAAPDPLARFRQAGGQTAGSAGGRNYKLPGSSSTPMY